MQNAATSPPRFLTRSSLLPGEYRTDFRQIDRDAIRLVRSQAARQVTTLMAHIYLCLVDAPLHLREREGVLRFAGEVREGKSVTAWEQLTELLEVADGTAHKALRWMADQKLIGYHAGKNGVGIRIFINRAVNSVKQESERKQKNLRLTPAANGEAHVSQNEMPFNNYRREIVDIDKEFRAPKNGANIVTSVEITSDQPTSFPDAPQQIAILPEEKVPVSANNDGISFIPASVVDQLRDALEPQLRLIVMQAATNAAAREHERTRQWLDQHGLPKAARVAQREAYSIFKHQSAKTDAAERARADLQVGRNVAVCSPPKVRPHTAAEIAEIAEICVTMLEVQGKAIDETLAEISAAPGGWVAMEDVPKVSETAYALLRTKNERSCSDVCTAS